MKRFSICLGAALLLMLISFTTASGKPMCGDVNDDGTINIGDPVFLITYIFHGGDAPYPLGRADVNADGSVNIGDAIWLVQYVFLGDFPPQCPPYAGAITGGQCKTFGMDTDQDCINWLYDGEATLTVNHINAGFNCCPIQFYFDIDITNGVITVTESEEEMGCDCNCLFDITYDIYEIPKGEYTIIFNEPYVSSEDEPLTADIDLTQPGSGSFCVTRTHYPWLQ